MHSPLIITFGKWRGFCASCTAEYDRDYVRWCLTEPWFAVQYPELNAAWRAMGIMPKVKCSATTVTGTRCENWSKHGTLCTTHYRVAEREMAAVIDSMEWETIS